MRCVRPDWLGAVAAGFALAVFSDIATASPGDTNGAPEADARRPVMLDRPSDITPRAASQLLLAAAFAGKRIVAVGQAGHIIYSDDNGATWRAAASVPTSATLTAVGFAGEREGWAAGHLGVVLRTDDAGVTWQRRLDGVQAAQLVLASAWQDATLDDSEAKQKAVTFARLLVRDGPNKPFLALSLQDGAEAEVLGAYGLSFASRDGGRTWAPSHDRYDNPRALHYYGVARLDGNKVIVGEQGMVLRGSQNGPFKRVVVPYEGTLFGILATPSKTLVAYGLRGNVLLSRDGGMNWSRVPSGAFASLQAGTVLQDGIVVLVSDAGQLIASRNGGASFVSLKARAQPAAGILPVAHRAVLVLGPQGAQRVDLSAEPALK